MPMSISFDAAIKVSNLSKKYQLGSGVSLNLREMFEGIFKAKNIESNSFWAIDDISFEIKSGEAVGIIGKNGAGKSTLLKLLSKITFPTNGKIEIFGRVASLLEVGTGFHPELTGRENIYLNGTILGMTRKEVQRKFDEIVSFSGIEKFIDTPVKHYSSGMYVRLAFAVAAHLEPEILIVDEVLAVGDSEFQKKCLGKMSDISQSGERTVLFVSHNMAAINSLCSKVIVLNGGKIAYHGDTQGGVSSYLNLNLSSSEEQGVYVAPDAQPGEEGFFLHSIRLLDPNGLPTNRFAFSQPITVEIAYSLEKPLPTARIGILLAAADGTYVFESFDMDTPGTIKMQRPGKNTLKGTIPAYLLNQGNYLISFYAGIHMVKHFLFLEFVIGFEIEPIGDTDYTHLRRGYFYPQLNWKNTQELQ